MSRSFNQLQFSDTTNDYIQITEIEVYTPSGENIALLGTASFVNADAWFGKTADLAIDGNTNTAGDESISICYPGGIWVLDFDRDYTQDEIDKIVYYNRDSYGSRAGNCILTLHSSDGLDPVQVATLNTDLVQTFYLSHQLTTVDWVQDSEGRYEISSKEHLIQVMNQGSVYTNSGSEPTNYWSSGYIQTANIDLVDVQSQI